MSEMVKLVAIAMCRERYGSCVCEMPHGTRVTNDCTDKLRLAKAALRRCGSRQRRCLMPAGTRPGMTAALLSSGRT